jgi:hypothetical protein
MACVPACLPACVHAQIFGPQENAPLDLTATTAAFEALALSINAFQREAGVCGCPS